MSSETRLRVIKSVHTVVWAFFAGCILAIPFQAWRGRFGFVLVLIGLFAGEIVILSLNTWRCPLTAMAAIHTHDRRDNFDIYLPEWLARYNKLIFGLLFGAGLIVSALLWLASPR